MSHQPRSVYEYGDPVHEQIAREERTDHHHATARGQRVLLLADRLVSVLHASGAVANVDLFRAYFFNVLADELYDNVAIDVPDFASVQSLEAFRQGRSA